MSTAPAIVPGSLSVVANQAGTSIAEAFLNADVVVIVDVSGSMDTKDSRGGRRRYDVACDELRRLQADLPGKIAVVAFSSTTVFVPGGVPPFLSGGTNLAGALEFVQPADGTVRFIVISDGEPNDEFSALRFAHNFASKIDTIYVGPKDNRAAARFLEELARASGGRFATAARAAKLAEKVQTFMLQEGL